MHCTRGRGLGGEAGPVPAAPCELALSLLPLWLIQGVLLFLFLLPEEGRDIPVPALTVVQAEAGVCSPRGGMGHPALLLTVPVNPHS